MEENVTEVTKSSTGLESNVAGLLCYLLGWVSGLIFFLIEKDSKKVKFHAMQSILLFGGITVLFVILSVLQGILWSLAWHGGGGALLAISGLFGIISTILWIASLILWILLMVKAYQNEAFKLPVIGNIAEKQLQ